MLGLTLEKDKVICHTAEQYSGLHVARSHSEGIGLTDGWASEGLSLSTSPRINKHHFGWPTASPLCLFALPLMVI